MKKLALLGVLAVILFQATGCVVTARPAVRVHHPHRPVVVVR